MAESRASRVERAQSQRQLDTRTLMLESAAFRRLAYWLVFQVAPADGKTHAGEHTHQSAFNEGRRSFAIDVGRLLRNAHFESFQKMEREAHSARLEQGGHDDPESSGP